MKRVNEIAIMILLSFVSIISVSFLWGNPLLLMGITVTISALMLSVNRNKEYLVLYIFSGIFGAAAEIVAVYFGAWSYSLPQLFGITIWLPFLWGAVGVFSKRISTELHTFVTRNQTMNQ